MNYKIPLLTMMSFIIVVFTTTTLSAQTDDRKLEVGVQFSTLDLSIGRATVFSIFPCFVPPCPVTQTTSGQREMEPGFGARVGYNFNRFLTIEAETNFFPRERRFEGGRKVQLLAGAKAGKRFHKFGVFAKARPGILRLSKGDYRFGNGGCPAVFPPPVGCFEAIAKSRFAFDAGGIVEVYPTAHTLIRFDAGDTMVRYKARNVAVVIEPNNGVPPAARVVVVPAPAQTMHNLQLSVGFGFRF